MIDNNKSVTKIQKEITLRYIVALSLIAMLSTFAFYTLHNVLAESQDTGQIVNISGKQRMLSQHIALDVHRVHNASSSLSTYSELERKILNSHTKEMFQANKKLSTGVLSHDSSYKLSNTIKEMYFGDMNLSARVEHYIGLAEQFSKIDKHSEMDELVRQIDSLSEPLLKDLNSVVLQYQREGEEKLSNMQSLETIAWIATIFTLLLEVIFIFQPMVRKIVFLKLENDTVLQHLEDTVEIRTLHLEKANDKLAHLALHDPLTGLKNRLTLEQDIELAIQKYKEHNAPFAVLMFDIDWFKKVNDEYGHNVGDIVLKEISSILLAAVREGDKVYRAGGEEFVILLNRISYEHTANIAEKIRRIVQKHIFKVEDKEFSKTISCGLYHSSLVESSNVGSVLKLVDIALYKSKNNGRNRVTDVTDSVISSS